MTTMINCPRCQQQTDASVSHCSHCDVNLALAALMTESISTPTADAPSQVPITPELLVPRLGDSLVENGLLQPDDLQRALDHQKKRAADQQPILLGQALVQLDLIDQEALDQVITEQILSLQNAIRDANQQLEQRVQDRTNELQRALTQIKSLNQLKTNFISNISHELRTPLAHILGYVELMADEGLGPLNEGQNDAVAVILRSSQRLHRLIDDLIQFSLASQEEFSLRFGSVSLGKLIQVAISQATPKARAKNISLESAAPEDLPEVEADSEKITWVIQHLIENAIKFTESGGNVKVDTRLENASVALSVLDNGIGISPDRLGEIFEPFHQLDGSATRRQGGTGLGLALVRRIIEAHGAAIQVQSKEGAGSRFTFALPLRKEAHG